MATKAPPKITRPTPPKVTQSTAPTKKFVVEAWEAADEGEKVVGYGDTGLGKTTLFSMMPNPIFIGIDDGGRRIVNPKTQEPIQHIPGVETYGDVRAALQQTSLFQRGSSCVVDTFTLVEQIAERHVLETVPTSKGGRAINSKAYGYNEGSSHILDAIRLILQDLDGLIRRGVNVGLICQEQAITIANPEGIDYLQACPKLHHDRQYSVMLEICAWADHVFRLNYLNTIVRAEGNKTIGKIAVRDTTRVLYVQGALDYRAKSRTLGRFVDEDGKPIQEIAFNAPDNDSIWTFIFDKKETE